MCGTKGRPPTMILLFSAQRRQITTARVPIILKPLPSRPLLKLLRYTHPIGHSFLTARRKNRAIVLATVGEIRSKQPFRVTHFLVCLGFPNSLDPSAPGAYNITVEWMKLLAVAVALSDNSSAS